MIKEKFGNQAKVLAVGLLILGIDLKYRYRVVPVDFIARWMSHLASL